METIHISTAPTTINIPPMSLRPKHSRFPILSALKPSTNLTSSAINTKDAIKFNRDATTRTKTIYKDNWFHRIAINYLSQALQDTTGMRNKESGYESLVVASKAVFQSFNPIQQRQLIGKVLLNATPKPYISMFRTLMRPSKFSREFCAAFTTIFLVWLIGPCKVKESEFEGVREKNVVHIKKCRFLETSNCAGMCTNLCKAPTQEFMKNIFGMPINMVPNFEDMSCKYIFGEDPPSLQDDPALKQPCYKLCNVKHKHDTSCINKDMK
ncbi:hypothetical protein L1987_59587 [Smallanthus sonchifolius]|uniref:Uncharacterized protein n=1 Tax=Smallanthus sonchifolius TaxID=185202 RepID=A0ACB9D5M6_9ASTR|nr:hypothetical protein L1987_59587 [Smallanthus sonchifolius]